MKYSAEDLQKIRRYERRNGISYQRSGGSAYNRALLIGFLAWLFMMLMLLFYVLGALILISDKKEGWSWDVTRISIIAGFCILSISPFVYWMGERISNIQVCLRLTALIANICVLPVLAVMFVKMTLVKNSVAAPGSEISEYDPGFLGIKKLFFWRHGIPMAITFVSFLIVAIIIIVEQIKTKKSYNAIANNEYTPKIVEEEGAEKDEKEETDE